MDRPLPDAHAAHEIVVGVDGRNEGYEALDWAVRQAALTGATVRVVCAWHYVPEPSAYLTSPPAVTASVVAHAARRVAFDAAAAYDGSGVVVVPDAVQGIAWRALVDAAREADMLVLGTRSRSAAAGALLGSVTLRCMAHAPCPVVVVPSRRPADAPPAERGEPIVLPAGSDRSPQEPGRDVARGSDAERHPEPTRR